MATTYRGIRWPNEILKEVDDAIRIIGLYSIEDLPKDRTEFVLKAVDLYMNEKVRPVLTKVQYPGQRLLG